MWAAHGTDLAFIVMDIPSALMLPNLEVKPPMSDCLVGRLTKSSGCNYGGCPYILVTWQSFQHDLEKGRVVNTIHPPEFKMPFISGL